MRPARRMGGGFTFGGRVPFSLGVILVVTAVGWLGGLILQNNGIFPLVSYGGLVPGLVLHGQVWRLLTWVFVGTGADPIGLLFGFLMLYWFGRDLAMMWGSRRFGLIYAGMTVATGGVLTVAGIFLPRVHDQFFTGVWPMVDGLTVAWGLLHAGAQINIWFVLPVSGQLLVWITIGGTVLYALITGNAEAFLPHFVAEFLFLGFVRLGSPARLMARWRLGALERSAKRKAKHLRVVDKDGEPPRYLN